MPLPWPPLAFNAFKVKPEHARVLMPGSSVHRHLFVCVRAINQCVTTGGVQIVTGCNFIYFSAVEFFAGTGELTVLAGA